MNNFSIMQVIHDVSDKYQLMDVFPTNVRRISFTFCLVKYANQLELKAWRGQIRELFYYLLLSQASQHSPSCRQIF